MNQVVEPKVVEMYPKPRPEPFCSFCGKKKSQVTSLVSNRRDKNICGDCVTKAKELLG